MGRNRNFRVVDKNERPGKVTKFQQMPNNNKSRPEKKKKRKIKKKTFLYLAAVVMAVVVGGGVYNNFHTFEEFEVLETHENKKAGANHFRRFADGVLKYSADGMTFINNKGDEVWNYSYQIKNSELTFYYDECGAVYDKGGNDIFVFDKKGSKGNVKTSLPIEKASVSSQGIVSVILRNEPSSKIICYDLAGNVLIEFKSNLSGMGYPMDIAVAGDGKSLAVSYMYMDNGRVNSRVSYYDFSKKKASGKEYKVLEETYKDEMIPEVFFMGDDVFVAAGSKGLSFYTDAKKPELLKKVKIEEEIKGVFNDKENVGVIVKKEKGSVNEIRLYDKKGEQVMSCEFEGEVSEAKIRNGEIIAYGGKECRIFNKSGVLRFSGETEENIIEVYPASGVNKYVIISAGGGEIVRLTK